MKKRWVVLIALLSFGAGAGAASWYWTDLYSRYILSALVLRTEANLVTRVAQLERLRAGKVEEATALQEGLLDGDLIGAGALVREGAMFNVNARHAVELEAKARVASGYAPADPGVRRAVQEALRLVSAAARQP